MLMLDEETITQMQQTGDPRMQQQMVEGQPIGIVGPGGQMMSGPLQTAQPDQLQEI